MNVGNGKGREHYRLSYFANLHVADISVKYFHTAEGVGCFWQQINVITWTIFSTKFEDEIKKYYV
jgi:hypothetical protein